MVGFNDPNIAEEICAEEEEVLSEEIEEEIVDDLNQYQTQYIKQKNNYSPIKPTVNNQQAITRLKKAEPTQKKKQPLTGQKLV
jgi:hypothetical protein